jgi:hypothetical protein
MAYPPTGGNYDTLPTETDLSTAPTPRKMKPLRGLLRPRTQSTKSLLDEIIPTPTSDENRSSNGSLFYLARRTGSVAVISIFLLSIIFLASTEGRRKAGGDNLRHSFGEQAVVTSNVALTNSDSEVDIRPHPIDGK